MSVPQKEDEEELKPRNINEEESEFANEPSGFCALSESIFIPKAQEQPLRTLETMVENDLESIAEEEEKSDESGEKEKEIQIEEKSLPENKTDEVSSPQEAQELTPEVMEIHEEVDIIEKVIEHSEQAVQTIEPVVEPKIMEDKSVNTDFSDLQIFKMHLPTILLSKGVDTSELIQEEDTEIQDASDYCNDELPKCHALLTPDRNDQTDMAVKALKARLMSRFDGIRSLLQNIKDQQIQIKKHFRKSIEKALKIFSDFALSSLEKLVGLRY